jgi:hypothetical protein
VSTLKIVAKPDLLKILQPEEDDLVEEKHFEEI